MRKVLFASSEVYPFVKTGGLADVSASLPVALHALGHDVRIVMPAYRACLQQLADYQVIASLRLQGYTLPIEILATTLPDSELIVWLVHSPYHFDRSGGPYQQENGKDWHDNAQRFTLFCRAVVALAIDDVALNWQADLIHCNDWQTGLIPALLSTRPNRPKTIFTIHNLAYQGIFDYQTFSLLELPQELWSITGIEFYGQISFMKGGLIFADHITTVSPQYAQEICHPEFGYNLAGLLQHLTEQGKVTGILNGIATDIWDPETDPDIDWHYSAKRLSNKKKNKAILQKKMALPMKKEVLVLGVVSRLVAQKGIDLIILAIDALLAEDVAIQMICLGSGEQQYQEALLQLQAQYPEHIAVEIGYDEALSHQIEAGVDVFLMPSRFEPCGLNQLYSLRYGTLPIVRHTGGLADSVIDNNNPQQDTGFVFYQAEAKALVEVIKRALSLYQQGQLWRKRQRNAMRQDVGWQHRAVEYSDLYQTVIQS